LFQDGVIGWWSGPQLNGCLRFLADRNGISDQLNM